MIVRPSRFRKTAFVFAIPDSTSHAAKTRRMAEKSDGRPNYLAHLGYVFGGIDHPERSDAVPFLESRLRNVPAGIFHPGTTQTRAGALTERRCCFSGIAFVMSPPATSVTSGKKLSEALHRQQRRCVAPRRMSPIGRNKTDAAHQVREVAPLSVLPPFFSRRS